MLRKEKLGTVGNKLKNSVTGVAEDVTGVVIVPEYTLEDLKAINEVINNALSLKILGDNDYKLALYKTGLKDHEVKTLLENSKRVLDQTEKYLFELIK